MITIRVWEYSVKVGDLVKLKEYCAQGGRIALVVGFAGAHVKMVFSHSGKKILALKSNVEVISESR